MWDLSTLMAWDPRGDPLNVSACAIRTNGWDDRAIYTARHCIDFRAPGDYTKVRILWPMV